MLAALPAAGHEAALAVELIPGHPIYHEDEKEAGVAMALAITPRDHPADLTVLCDELRIAAGLDGERGDLRLETIFVVPYKGLAVEGYYWPHDGSEERNALVPGGGVARATLDGIVARAGIPPRVLDETGVEHEISCSTGEPRWDITWSDVRLIGEEAPDAVIERARERFLAVHQSVVEHGAMQLQIRHAQRTARGG
jgi:hypothetical protein